MPNQSKDIVKLLSSLGFRDGMMQDDVEISVEDSNTGKVFAVIYWGLDTTSPTAKVAPFPLPPLQTGVGLQIFGH